MPTITPLAAPATANSQQQGQQSSKERAIAAFNAAKQAAATPQSQEHPVINPTSVSPEETSAVIPATSKGGQTTDSENSSSDSQAATPAKEEEAPLSSQYAVLARKEKALRAKAQAHEQTIRQREAAIAEREAAIKAKEAEYQSNYIPKNRLTEDTLNTLLEAGIDYDQITQMALNQATHAQVDPATKLAIQRLEEKVQAQQQALEEANKQKEQSVQNQYQEALRQIRYDADNLVKADPAFELVRETGSVKDVVDLIEKTYKEDGVILTVEEAASAVEDYLVERLSKYAKTNKIQQRLQPVSKTPAPQQSASQKQQSAANPIKTLTNDLGSTRPLTAKERAVLAFNGKLNK